MKIEHEGKTYKATRWGKPRAGELYIAHEEVTQAHFDFTKDFVQIVEEIDAPEPPKTYAERQAEWVKEHGVKVGGRVKVVRMFGKEEQGFIHYNNPDIGKCAGAVVDVAGIDSEAIVVDAIENTWHVPYFVLQPVKPTTRPMTRDEFLAAWRKRGWCPLVETDGYVRSVKQVEAGDSTSDMKLHVEGCGWMTMNAAKHLRFISDNSPLTVESYE